MQPEVRGDRADYENDDIKMPELSRSTISPPDTDRDDLRLGHIIQNASRRGEPEQPGDRSRENLAAVFVGFPSDAGVVANGGRPGAARAPAAIRENLYRLTPDARDHAPYVHLVQHTADLGDVVLGEMLESDQEALGETLAPFVKDSVVPIILGGGHETTFGHFLSHVFAGREVGVLNWDAHPDVRPLKDGRSHSGSPFRQILTHVSGSCTGYTVAGLLPQHVSSAHVDWIAERDGAVIWRDDVTATAVDELYRGLDRPTMVSFDLDAVDHASAPGVSAPSAHGLAPDIWLKAAYEAGRSRAVVSMDIVELNPTYDPDGRTARLAALTIWMFLRGLSERIAG